MTNVIKQGLGLCAEHEIIYRVLGETESSEVIARPVQAGSKHDVENTQFVNVGGMLVDRGEFHGHDIVIVEQCVCLG